MICEMIWYDGMKFGEGWGFRGVGVRGGYYYVGGYLPSTAS